MVTCPLGRPTPNPTFPRGRGPLVGGPPPRRALPRCPLPVRPRRRALGFPGFPGSSGFLGLLEFLRVRGLLGFPGFPRRRVVGSPAGGRGSRPVRRRGRAPQVTRDASATSAAASAEAAAQPAEVPTPAAASLLPGPSPHPLPLPVAGWCRVATSRTNRSALTSGHSTEVSAASAVESEPGTAGGRGAMDQSEVEKAFPAGPPMQGGPSPAQLARGEHGAGLHTPGAEQTTFLRV